MHYFFLFYGIDISLYSFNILLKFVINYQYSKIMKNVYILNNLNQTRYINFNFEDCRKLNIFVTIKNKIIIIIIFKKIDDMF